MDMTGLVGVLATGGSDNASNFSITSLLSNAGVTLRTWGTFIVFILGVAAIIVATYKLVTGLASHGQKQTSWAVVIILYVVGGVCTFGSSADAWDFLAGTIAGGGRTTVEEMGTSKGENEITITTDGGAGGTVVFDAEANTLYL